jgi:hypothetical protein
MIRINYVMTAKQPIFTGSDEDAGTMKTFRREKRLLSTPIKEVSVFKSENARRTAILSLFEAVWSEIDFENMKPMRRMKIWDEFSSKVLAATHVRTRYQFLNELCRSFNVRSLNKPVVWQILERFLDDELLGVIRDEHQYLILLFRDKNQNKIKLLDQGGGDLFSEDADREGISFVKTSDYIPVVSGNSIRGIIRRLVMRDYCRLAGITKLNKDIYHQLFTGGSITGSTDFEDIAKREEYINVCPMMGLFGSAIGNMTIEGDLKVGGARPICREHGDGEVSFWEMLGVDFGTRRDDSKTETDIEIIGKEDGKKDAPQQMKYGYEILVVGTRLSHQFVCTTANPLIESAFWRMLKMFRECPFIGGTSGVGHGEVDLSYAVPDRADDAYVSHIKAFDGALPEKIGAFA